MATAKVVGIAAAPLEAAVDQVCRQVNHEASSPVELVHCAPARGGGAAKQLRWLRQYKCLCDELLPALRERSHLHNLIYRHKHNATLGLCRRADGALLGGATFRAYWVRGEAGGRRQQQLVGPNGGLAPGRRIVLEVLLIVVGQRPGVCGHGHGTRVVNALKRVARLLAERAASPQPRGEGHGWAL